MTCKTCENGEYPIYGPAPHECYWRKEGGFEKNPLGTSTIEPLCDWPDNFLLEVEEAEDLNNISWGHCGIYFCPDCKAGMTESTGLISKKTVLERINND